MKILVTGMHRSGTSLVAHLLSSSAGLSLYDDPDWAIFETGGPLAYRTEAAYKEDLMNADAVKCPRMAEVLPDVINDFPTTQVVFVVRDPRDVFCSINEAKLSRSRTIYTMLDNRRFGQYELEWQGVALCARRYFEIAYNTSDRYIKIISYEHFCALRDKALSRVTTELGLAGGPVGAGLWLQQWAPPRNKASYDQTIKGERRWAHELSLSVSNGIMRICGDYWERVKRRSII